MTCDMPTTKFCRDGRKISAFDIITFTILHRRAARLFRGMKGCPNFSPATLRNPHFQRFLRMLHRQVTEDTLPSVIPP